MAKKFGFEQTGRNGGAIDFDESTIAARTEVVDGTRKKLLARAGFAEKQNRGPGGSRKLHLAERALQCGAFADNLLEVEFAANFFFEVKLFDGQLVFQRVDFFEGERVFDGDSDLRADRLQQFHVGRSESIDAAAGKIQGAEGVLAVDQRDAANRLQTFPAKRVDHFIRVIVELRAARQEGPARSDGAARGRIFQRNNGVRLEDALVGGEIEGVDSSWRDQEGPGWCSRDG